MTDKQDVIPTEAEGRAEESLKPAQCSNCEGLKTQAEEYKTGWQRALADYQNLQKETAARRSELARISEQQILEEFIPVYEHLKLAFRLQTSDFSPEQQKWADGIGYIMKQFNDVLKAHGVEEIKTIGEKFDARLHETVGEEEAEGKESGIIIKEVEGGYKMGDRVIKPAKVIISK